MTTVYKAIQVEASKARIWKSIADLGAIMHGNPYVDKSYYNSTQREGVGASRICEMPANKMVLEETVVDWREGESYTVRIEFKEGMAPPVGEIRATMAVRGNGDQSILSMSAEYQPKYGPIGAIMDRFMIRPQYERMFANLLLGMKHHIETGEAVDMGVVRGLRAVSAPV